MLSGLRKLQTLRSEFNEPQPKPHLQTAGSRARRD
jgi:hypothetical protein